MCAINSKHICEDSVNGSDALLLIGDGAAKREEKGRKDDDNDQFNRNETVN